MNTVRLADIIGSFLITAEDSETQGVFESIGSRVRRKLAGVRRAQAGKASYDFPSPHSGQ